MQNYFNDTQNVLNTTENLINNDIKACQTALITSPNFFDLQSWDVYECATNLFTDNMDELKDTLEALKPDELNYLCTDTYDIGIKGDQAKQVQYLIDQVGYRELADDFCIDDATQEPLEWWLVSEYLAEQLESLGFVTLETDWGVLLGTYYKRSSNRAG